MNKQVAVIGGGIAGLSIARDLTLRNFDVVLFDKQKIGNGTTVQCAGMLHSGARYVTKDLKIAKLCLEENKIIQRIIPHAVGKKNAYFVRYIDDDLDYEKKFIEGCKKVGIPVRRISGDFAKQNEPKLGSKISHAFETPDKVIDTFTLVFSYLDDLKKRSNVKIYESTEIKFANFNKDKWNIKTDKATFSFDFVINSSGDGLSQVSKLFGQNIELSYIYGSMALFSGRLSSRIVTRCAPNATGDVIVPAHKYTLIGSTWHERDRRGIIKINKEDEKEIRKIAGDMIPSARDARLLSSLTGVRTHPKDDSYSGSFGDKRDFLIINHQDNNSGTYINFMSVLPGKMTIARYVAEQAGDIVCKRLNIKKKSITAITPIKEPTNIPKRFKFYIN